MYAKNAWNKYSENKQDLISFCEDYKKFITKGKTERRCVEEAILEAEKAGFKNIDSFKSLKYPVKVIVLLTISFISSWLVSLILNNPTLYPLSDSNIIFLNLPLIYSI